MEDVLCLDVGYRPWQIVSWQDAIVWVLEKVVEVIDEHPDRYIRTPSWSVKMPSVVRFLRPIPKKRAVKFSRLNIYLRDKGKCQYCGNPVPKSEMTYEHVIPRAQGGKTCWENVVVGCIPCNQQKGNRTPGQAKMHLRSVPVRPKKLPDLSFTMGYRKGMPVGWKTWLRDAVYWDGALEQDGSLEG